MTALNYADKVMYGGKAASAAYLGAIKIFPTFKPTDIAGCAIWMDASKLRLANGAAVSAWPNLGSGSQPTITAGATFRTNALYNVMPCVRMTQGSGKMRWYSGTGVDKDWTLIYLARRWQLRNGRIITGFASTSNMLVGFWNAYNDQCYLEGWITPQATAQTTQWKIYSADSTSAAPGRFFSNGVLLGTGTATPSKGWGGAFCINGSTDDADIAASEQADCEICEVVLYNRKISDAERQQVEAYLRYKWNPISPFKPTDLGSSLVGWFDGGDAASVQITGSGVSNWINKGVGGMTLTQGTDANRPKYANQTVTFTTPQQLAVANCPSGFDVIWVGRPNPVSTGEWRTLFRGTTSSHHVIVETGSTRLGTYNAGFFQAGALAWDNVWGLGFGRFGAAAVSLSRDGGTPYTTGTTLTAADVPIISFGAYQGPPPTQGWGDIKEMIFLPYNLDAARQQVEGYLANRWGLTGLLPAGHPYKNAPP